MDLAFPSLMYSNRPIAPFCNRLQTSPSRLSCTLDREAVSVCNLAQFTSAIPAEYQYFNSGPNFGSENATRVGGSVTVADFCPFQEVSDIAQSPPQGSLQTSC